MAIEPSKLPPHSKFLDLRTVAPLLHEDDAHLIGRSKSTLEFHANHKFCGRCGHKTMSAVVGTQRECTNDECKRTIYPRTDPVVITLVYRGGTADEPLQVLLGRKAVFPPGMFSLLAGFVSLGESLETAAVREVLEESGVHVDFNSCRILCNQPWSNLGGQLMVGIEARATSTDIDTSGDEELETARWFTLDELAQMIEASDRSVVQLREALVSGRRPSLQDADLRIPPPSAIAGTLLRDFLGRNTLQSRL